MADKITILVQDPISSSIIHSVKILELSGHKVEMINISDDPDVNFIKRYWEEMWARFWRRILGMVSESYFPDRLAEVVLRKSVKAKADQVLVHLRSFQPPILIATSHDTIALVSVLKAKGFYRGAVAVLFPNFEVDHFWVNKYIELYICNSTKQADTLKAFNIPSSKIVVINHSLEEKFFTEIPKSMAAETFGLLTTMPTVLVFAESENCNVLKESCIRLIRSSNSFQVVVVCGDNQKVKDELESLTSPVRHPVKILSQVEDLDVLLSSASVVITSMLELRLAQAAAKRIPIVVTDAVSVNEHLNLTQFLQNRAVVFGRIPAEVVFLVESMLEGKRLVDLDSAFELIAQPKNSIGLANAIGLIKPPAPVVRVQNYQAK